MRNIDKLISEDYQKGLTYKRLREKYNCSDKLISKSLTATGTKKNRKNKKIQGSRFSLKDQNKICSMYVDGENCREISEKYQCSKTRILRVLNINHIQRRTISQSKRKYSLYENAFKEPSDDCLYWVGFIMADGNIYKQGKVRTMQIALNKKDFLHLDKLKKFLESNKPIYNKVSKRQYTDRYKISKILTTYECMFAVQSKIIFDDLMKYGIVERKSKVAEFKKEYIFNKNLWRGLIDGDGSLYFKDKKYIVLSLCGSVYIMKQFVLFLKKEFNISAKISKNKSIYRVRIFGKNAKTVIKELYENSKYFLDRKMELAKSCF
jgi:Mor family transcriptional regulator